MARDRKIEYVATLRDDMGPQLKRLSERVRDFARRAAANVARLTAAFAAAGAAAFALANRISQRLDVYDKLSIRLGVTVEALSQLEFVAERSGMTFRSMEMSLQRMGRRIQEVALFGRGEAIPALRALNLNVQDLLKLSLDQQLLVLADAFENNIAPTQQLTVAMKLFDAEGVTMLQFLKDGADGLRNLAREADALGATISREAVDRSRDFQDALANLRGAMRGVSAEGTINLMPVLTDVINVLARNLPSAIAFVDVGLIKIRRRFVQVSSAAAGFASSMLRFADLFPDNPLNIGARQGAERFNEIADDLMEQAAAYGPVIQKAQEYHRELRDIARTATGLTGDTPTVRGFDESVVAGGGDDGLELFNLNRIRSKIRPRKIVEMFNVVEEAGKQAARNVQDAFAEFFFDPFDEGLRGLLANFVQAMRRMLAEVLAFQTVKTLFGGQSGLGAVFGSIFGRAAGGPVAPGQSVRVHEGEVYTAGRSGGHVTSRAAQRANGGSVTLQPITNIDARGASTELIERLPKFMEDRDKRLLLLVKRYMDTGVLPI